MLRAMQHEKADPHLPYSTHVSMHHSVPRPQCLKTEVEREHSLTDNMMYAFSARERTVVESSREKTDTEVR